MQEQAEGVVIGEVAFRETFWFSAVSGAAAAFSAFPDCREEYRGLRAVEAH